MNYRRRVDPDRVVIVFDARELRNWRGNGGSYIFEVIDVALEEHRIDALRYVVEHDVVASSIIDRETDRQVLFLHQDVDPNHRERAQVECARLNEREETE